MPNHRQILQAAQMAVHRDRLASNADDAPYFIGFTQDIVTGDRYASTIRF
jgi:hypothetical protein